MILILVRHGESKANRLGIYQGQTFDTPLTPQGRRQAVALSKKLKIFNPHIIFSSPLKRTKETAAVISREINIPFETIPAIMEINHGRWEGRNAVEVSKVYKEDLIMWKKKPKEVTMPEGEKLSMVRKRVFKFIDQVAEDLGDKTIVVVTHDAVIRVIIAEALGLSLNCIWRFHLDNCAVNVVRWGKEKQVLTLNAETNNGNEKFCPGDLHGQAL